MEDSVSAFVSLSVDSIVDSDVVSAGSEDELSCSVIMPLEVDS